MGLADSYITLRVRWWVHSKQTNVAHIRAKVILVLYKAAKAAAIDLPFPTSVILFTDQSEPTDGDIAGAARGLARWCLPAPATGGPTIRLQYMIAKMNRAAERDRHVLADRRQAATRLQYSHCHRPAPDQLSGICTIAGCA